MTQEQVASIVRTIGLEKYVRPLVPRALIERFPSDEGVVREEKLDMVDWEHTDAIASGQGLIYVVADDEAERRSIRDSLAADLAAAKGLTGEPIAREVYRREELYEGNHVDLAPDLIFDQRPGVHTSEAMGQEEVMSAPTDWRGENVPEGMVLFHGTDIAAGELDQIRISDVAPTLLHWMGHAVPTDMDGKPVTAAFADGSDPDEQAVESRSPLPERSEHSREVDDEVRGRLEDIGYME